MTHPQIVKCPKCSFSCKVKMQQLTANRRARCPKCQTIFIVEENLVTPTSTNTDTSIAKNAQPTVNVKNVQPTVNAKSTTALGLQKKEQKNLASTSQPKKQNLVSDHANSDDGLIFDAMDDASDAIDDIDELANLGADWSEDSVLQSIQNMQSKPNTSFFKDTLEEEEEEDNAWLEALLEEQTTNNDGLESQNLKTMNPESNVSKTASLDKEDSLDNLLNELGINTVNRAIPEQSIQRMHDRLKSPKNRKGATKKSFAKSILINLLWLLGCLLLILLLMLQYVLFNFDTLVKQAKYRQNLQSLCDLAGCDLPSTDLTDLVISNMAFRKSQLSSTQTDIIAALTNNSNQDQLYPALKVSIYANNQLSGEFIASPAQYLIVPQRLMSSKKNTLFMFTVDLPIEQVQNVEITPIY